MKTVFQNCKDKFGLVYANWALVYVHNSKLFDFLRLMFERLTDDGLLVFTENVIAGGHG
jgi:hypothetical protein